MTDIKTRLLDPEQDPGLLADWFTILEGEKSTEASLKQYYSKNKERITSELALDAKGNPVGFYWATRNQYRPEKAFLSLYVQPGERGRGVGRRLYENMEKTITPLGVTQIDIHVPDDCPPGLTFAQHRGFSEHLHLLGMELDLDKFDDAPFSEIIANLESEGFLFTSMHALENTEEVQRKLYALNDMTSMETPGSTGAHTWDTFEEFQQSVCQASWFNPAGQMIVIDTKTGVWVGMSAITRFDENDFAYNLHTGIDKRYRGRKLAQAVKVTALRYAREGLKVQNVRTHHNTLNDPMIAIDVKLGYQFIPGHYAMEKKIN
jgi:RimJ/RimL family protein N-acetyltransferase